MPDTEPVIDVESLLKPIEGGNPCGENLRYEGLHDDIKEAKRSDIGLDITEGKQSDWEQVIRLSLEALATQTKDLQVAAWLGEALVKKHGFSGLKASLKLMAGMHTLYWDNFYPEIDEGDLEERANIMASYDQQISACVKEASLTDAPGKDNVSFLRFQEASLPGEFQQIAKENPEESARIKANCERAAEEWERLSQATSREFYEALSDDLQQCWEGFTELDHLMDEKLERQTPGLGALKSALNEIRVLVDRVLKEKGGSTRAADGPGDESFADPDGGRISVGALHSRQEALSRLTEVAEYFQRTEPHSPVAYLVRRAVKWGNMPLDKWLQDIIKDSSVLDYVHETLGVHTNVEKPSE